MTGRCSARTSATSSLHGEGSPASARFQLFEVGEDGRGQCAWQASRSLVTARCRRVPACGLADADHAGDLPLDSPAWNFRAISSRSRGSTPERGADGGAAVRVVVGPGDPSAAGSMTKVAVPRSSPQLVERGIASDPEQPGALGPAGPVEAAPLSTARARTERRDVLGGGAIAQQRGHVGVDVRSAGAVERLERRGWCRSRRQRHGRGSHVRTTNEAAFITGGAIFVAMPVRRMVLCVSSRSPPCRRAPRRTRALGDDEICDTASNPDTIGVRGSMPGRRGAQLFMRFQLQLQRDDGSWRALGPGRQRLHRAGPRPWPRDAAGGPFVRPRHRRRAGQVYTLRGLVTLRMAIEGRDRAASHAPHDERRPPLRRGRRSSRLLGRRVPDQRVMRRAGLVALAALALPALPAHAREPGLWATINICDPPAKPGAVGVRVSIPRHGTTQAPPAAVGADPHPVVRRRDMAVHRPVGGLPLQAPRAMAAARSRAAPRSCSSRRLPDSS